MFLLADIYKVCAAFNINKLLRDQLNMKQRESSKALLLEWPKSIAGIEYISRQNHPKGLLNSQLCYHRKS